MLRKAEISENTWNARSGAITLKILLPVQSTKTQKLSTGVPQPYRYEFCTVSKWFRRVLLLYRNWYLLRMQLKVKWNHGGAIYVGKFTCNFILHFKLSPSTCIFAWRREKSQHSRLRGASGSGEKMGEYPMGSDPWWMYSILWPSSALSRLALQATWKVKSLLFHSSVTGEVQRYKSRDNSMVIISP